MAKDKTGNQAQADDLSTLQEVEVPASGDALAAAVAAGKQADTGYVTDVTDAKEVVELNGTKIVRW